MLGQSLPTPPRHRRLGEVTKPPVSPPLGPFSALSWSLPPAPTAQQSGPAPWEFSPGSPLPADTAAPGPSLSLFPPPPRLISWDRPPWPRPIHWWHSAHSEVPPAPPPSSTWGSLLSSTIVPTGVGYSVREQRRGEAGRGAAPATSLPGVQPCSRRVPHRVHWKGAPPQPARSARRLHRALARQRCSQRSVSKKPADARHPFPLLRLSFPYFWARNLLPEPLPPPPHPSWRPACVPRI